MSLYDKIMKKIPDYYPTMYQDGFTPEQILMGKRRQMLQEQEARELPTNIHITTEIKKK